MTRDEAIEIFRDEMLLALDKAAIKVFPDVAKAFPNNDHGATDADLPNLFKVLDKHFDVLVERFNGQFDHA